MVNSRDNLDILSQTRVPLPGIPSPCSFSGSSITQMSNAGDKIVYPSISSGSASSIVRPASIVKTHDGREFICGWGAAFINITCTFPMNKVMFRQVCGIISMWSQLLPLHTFLPLLLLTVFLGTILSR